MEEMYAIVNKNNNNLFWNNIWGWVEANNDAMNIDIYTKEEKELYSLPCEGMWHKF